jgi:hypothetical protein
VEARSCKREAAGISGGSGGVEDYGGTGREKDSAAGHYLVSEPLWIQPPSALGAAAPQLLSTTASMRAEVTSPILRLLKRGVEEERLSKCGGCGQWRSEREQLGFLAFILNLMHLDHPFPSNGKGTREIAGQGTKADV